ncbi:MAG: hypothetical protein AB7R67_20290 [Vicinamibacterales bacterium]
MAREKFVVRLLTAEHALLAWAEVYANPTPVGRGRSCPFRPEHPATRFVAERAGTAALLTVHWCDLDLARMTPVGPLEIPAAGSVLHFAWLEPIWLVPGMGAEVPLPPVTVRESVTIGVPPGGLGMGAPA